MSSDGIGYRNTGETLLKFPVKFGIGLMASRLVRYGDFVLAILRPDGQTDHCSKGSGTGLVAGAEADDRKLRNTYTNREHEADETSRCRPDRGRIIGD